MPVQSAEGIGQCLCGLGTQVLGDVEDLGLGRFDPQVAAVGATGLAGGLGAGGAGLLGYGVQAPVQLRDESHGAIRTIGALGLPQRLRRPLPHAGDGLQEGGALVVGQHGRFAVG